MLRLLFCVTLLLAVTPAFAQHTFRALVRDEHSGDPLAGVNVLLQNTTIGGMTDEDGLVVIEGVPEGRQTFVFSFIGFQTQHATFTFPLADPATPRVIEMEEDEMELEDVTVSATRTSRTIADVPTRVEVIAGEEIDEKISMDPSGLAMLLNESPGITVQQTSATSANATFRIQGLDGRYTQLLRDGFPLFGGFAGGLSILQIPPLDLRQVEVIKGPASTLYGGDAIAGIINLVSRTPAEEPERSLLLNATSAGGYDAAGFFSGRSERTGYTFLASANLQRPYDAEGDAFTNLPATRRFTVAPRFFLYGTGTLTAGVTAAIETREGGDVAAIRDGAAGFVERNTSRRLTSQLGYERPVGDATRLVLRNSASLFRRTIEVPDLRFAGDQLASYTEASLSHRRGSHDLVLGANLRTDRFQEDGDDAEALGYSLATFGLFAQSTWDATDRLAFETGLRADLQNEHGGFVLPRASVLYRFTETLSGRIGGGFGYKAPTVFLEPSEERAFRGVQPLPADIEAETSAGGTVDVNYRTLLFDRLALSFNQAFYLTRLRNPLVPVEEGDALRYRNADGPVQTRGLETNARLSLDDLKLFLGYVYLDAHETRGGARAPLPLTARHRTYTVLVYEQHGQMRFGLEGYYTSPQTLTDGSRAPGFWIAGVMGERRFGSFRAFLNFENILDTRQSRTSPLVLGPRQNPMFAEIWGPTDGFIVNGGLKIQL